MKKKKLILGIVLVVAILASIAAVTFAAEISGSDAWQAERLQNYRERLDGAVANGQLTEQQADELYQNRVDRMETCQDTCMGDQDGQGSGNYRRGFGGMMGQGRGQNAWGGCGYGAGVPVAP
jgi:hypothetical protein